MIRLPISVADSLVVSGPNGGGLACVLGRGLLVVSRQSATGIAAAPGRLAWSLQQADGTAVVTASVSESGACHLDGADMDVHDLQADPSGGHMAVLTMANAVVAYDEAWRERHRWTFPGEPDAMHLNSLCLHRGRWLVSAFGRFDNHRGYKGRTLGAGLVIDLETQETVLEGLSQPHSLVSHGDSLHHCDSERREVVFFAGEPGERRVALPGYPRGLHITARHVYVGLSRSRNDAAPGPVERFEGSAVAVLAWPSLEEVGFFQLAWNEIYDIRALDPQLLPVLADFGLEEAQARVVASEEARIRSEEEATREREQTARTVVHLQSQSLELEGRLRLELEAARVAERERAGLREQLAASERQRERLKESADALQRHWEETDAARRAESVRVAELTQRTEELVDRLEAAEAEGRWVGEQAARLSREVARLALSEQWLRRVLASRSWRWTRPIRLLMRTLSAGRLQPEDRITLARMFGRVRKIDEHGTSRPLTQVPLETPRLPAAAREGKADVIVFAVIDWHFRMQRPQHLSRALSELGHRVVYVSNNFIDAAGPGFEAEPLDEAGRLFQVRLHLAGAPAIYHAPPLPEQLVQLEESLDQVRHWLGGGRSNIAMVHHAYWTPLAERIPGAQLVYDCMDHHDGFGNNGRGIAREEERLVRRCDLVVTTSAWLESRLAGDVPVRVVRNGCEYERFSQEPPDVIGDPARRPVIGYYGAIAEWFDVELVERVARAHPEASIVLVGADSVGAGARLARWPNVRMVGEVPYETLPRWLHGFDVCILPFQVVPLTLATNPVKVYEYLAAGKPVVSVNLPEMAQFAGLVSVAGDPDDFVDAVGRILHAVQGGDAAGECARREFAAEQTWRARAGEFERCLAEVRPPLVSVVVVTYNNLDYTRACLDSLERHGDWAELEVIVVDNASGDGTPEFLQEWARSGPRRRVELNPDNRGFAAANNQGLALAAGDYLVLLNNDTYVTRGWVRGLVGALRETADAGLVGPVTNNIGNEARVEIAYADMDQMRRQALFYAARHRGRLTPIPTLAFFCVAMSRATWERIGPLDEAFGLGFFEDDDYCRRIEQAGLRPYCIEDVFVHHHLSASFDALRQERRQALFERNRALYEAKWGEWRPHRYRGTGVDAA